jgi:hypothetical protein
LLQAVRQGADTRAPVFEVGVADTLPKLVVRGMLQPALGIQPARGWSAAKDCSRSCCPTWPRIGST